jgi:hypothetical protein
LTLFVSLLPPISLPQASAAPALVTCINLQTGTERISQTGSCRYAKEAQANWHKNLSDSIIESGPLAKVIVVCSNKESSAVSYQLIRKKCQKHQLTTVFSRSGSLPTKPLIADAYSYEYDSAFLKLATDPTVSPDAPIAFYTITSTTVDNRTPKSVQSQKVYSPNNLRVIINSLQPSTSYTFTVSATTADGTSPISIASIPVTTPAYVPPSTLDLRESSSTNPSVTVAAPAFTLSSTTETKVVNNAISGYTISSTGGAIASYSISPAVPTGITFNTSTGLMSGTPTSSQSATSYTITATNAGGSSNRSFTLTITAIVTGPAAKLAVSRSSVGTSAGVAFSTQPQVTVQDANGNTITSSTAVVSATISARGSLIGTATATASAGVATFNNLGVRGFGATAYTITYATAGLTSATEVVTPSAYALGATGPGGGKIYYIAPNADGFNCGEAFTSTCFYLEVAPSDWIAGSDAMPWAISAYVSSNIAAIPDGGGFSDATFDSIGRGWQYSKAIVDQNVNPYNSTTNRFAAGAARAYTGQGLNDWYLPSTAELNTLCQWSRGLTQSFTTPCSGGSNNSPTYGAESSALGGTYWSSSENGASNNGKISLINNQGGVAGSTKDTAGISVRPIRAF